MTCKDCSTPCPASYAAEQKEYYDSHYTAMDGFEPIEVMQRILSYEEFKGFLKGNVIKYSMRAGHKEGETAEKDAAKATRYAQWLSKVQYTDPDIVINPKED